MVKDGSKTSGFLRFRLKKGSHSGQNKADFIPVRMYLAYLKLISKTSDMFLTYI
jgi:hypothetical protein